MVDVARAPFTLDSIKRVIRVASVFKINMIMYRESDDEFCTIRYGSNGLGADNPFAFTMADMRTLLEYASRYYVKFVPEVESLGHSHCRAGAFESLIVTTKQYYLPGQNHATIKRFRKSNMLPGNPKVFDLMYSIYNEWFSIMPDNFFFHIGMDEIKNIKSSQMLEHSVMLFNMMKNLSIVHNKKVNPILWSDGPFAEFSPNAIRCIWYYGDHKKVFGAINPSNKFLQKQHFPEILAATSQKRKSAASVWVTTGAGSGLLPYSRSPYRESFETMASWAQFMKTTRNFQGFIAAQWHGNQIEDWFPDFVAAADMSWKPYKVVPEFDLYFPRIVQKLEMLEEVRSPSATEVNKNAWAGIWVENGEFAKEIIPQKMEK